MATRKPPRLWYRPAYYDPETSKLRKQGTWVIVDGRTTRVLGIGLEDRTGAERALAAYLGDKHEPSRRKFQQLDEILIADVLSIYMRDVVPDHSRPDKTGERIEQLLQFWGEKTLADISKASCRDYVTWRCAMPWKSARPDKTGVPARMVTPAGARRELEDFRAAVNHHAGEELHLGTVRVHLPPKGVARHRYLRRSELATMLWIAWRLREQAKVLQGSRKGTPVVSSKRPMRHVARFLLVGVYTGSRAAAICGAAFTPTPGHGWIDLRSGLFYRKDQNEVETNKRQPTVLVPRRLLIHLRRWKRKNPTQKFVVEFNGKPIEKINKAFARLAQLAGVGSDVVPHTLRHTCATWLSQRGATMSEAAGFLGMSEAIYDSVYRKFSPTNRIAGFQAVPIFEIFGTPYHPSETILDDGWVEEDEAAA